MGLLGEQKGQTPFLCKAGKKRGAAHVPVMSWLCCVFIARQPNRQAKQLRDSVAKYFIALIVSVAQQSGADFCPACIVRPHCMSLMTK